MNPIIIYVSKNKIYERQYVIQSAKATPVNNQYR